MKQFRSLFQFNQDGPTKNENIRFLQNHLEEVLAQLTNSPAFTIVDGELQITNPTTIISDDSSVNGPHIEVKTSVDDYPVLQQLNWSHDNINFGFDAFYDGNWRSSDAGSNFLFAKNSDTLAWKYDSSVSQNGLISWNAGLVMDTSGNIGIGTASPSVELHVVGDIRSDLYQFEDVNGRDSTTKWSAYNYDGLFVIARQDSNFSWIENTMTIDTSSRGTFSTGQLCLGSSSVSTGSCYLEIGSSRTDSGYSYIDLIGDTTYTDYGLRLIRYDSGANAHSILAHRGTGTLYLNVEDAGSLIFQTNSTPAVTIDSSQNIGIGTASPTQKVDITTTTVANEAPWGHPCLTVKDDRAYALGVGGGIIFEGKYTSGGAYSTFGGIRGHKTNATDGSYIGSLDIWARDNALRFRGASPTDIDSFDAHMTINSAGDAGIGISPSYRLDVKDDVASWVANFFNDGNNVNRYGIRVQCGTDDQSATTNYYFGAFDGDGNAEGYLRVLNGTFELIQSSDKRRKSNITDTKINGLEVVNGLQVREFNFSSLTNEISESNNLHVAGLVAQEVEKVYPSMVSEVECTKFLSMTQLVPVLVKAVQELSDEVKELKKQ